jgi:uncharacterized protein YjbJ (UPF0337 family)
MDKDRIAGSAKNFTGSVEGTVGDIAGDTDTEAAGRVRQAAGRVQNLYGQAKDAARDASDTATNYAKQLYRQGDAGSETIARLVQENPLASLLIAGGIGFVLAALLMRSPSPRRRRWRYYG